MDQHRFLRCGYKPVSFSSPLPLPLGDHSALRLHSTVQLLSPLSRAPLSLLCPVGHPVQWLAHGNPSISLFAQCTGVHHPLVHISTQAARSWRAPAGSFSCWCPRGPVHSQSSRGARGVNGSLLSEPLSNHSTCVLSPEPPPPGPQHTLVQPRAHPGTSCKSGSESWLQNLKMTWDTPSVSVSSWESEGKNRTYSMRGMDEYNQAIHGLANVKSMVTLLLWPQPQCCRSWNPKPAI